jgi:hypothetical protein
MYIYAIGNIRGFYDLFEDALALVDLSGDNKLVLLGDYIRVGPDSYKILDRVMALEAEYGTDKVIALRGNQEKWTLEGEVSITSFEKDDLEKDITYINWFKTLRPFYKYGNYLFFNYGEAEETDKSMLSLYQEQLGKKKFKKKEFNIWTHTLVKVITYPAIFGHTYKDYLNDTIEEWNSHCIDESGFVNEVMLADTESSFKRPQVIKIDPTNESGEHRRFWCKRNGEHIEREGTPNWLNVIQMGRRELA